MCALKAEEVMRPALILLAHDNERLAGNQNCLSKALDDAYLAARLVLPIVRLHSSLRAPELEHSAFYENVFDAYWNNDQTVPGCLDVNPDGFFCVLPEGIFGQSVLGTFAGLAAEIVAGRFQRDDARGVTAFNSVVSQSRIILKNCGFDPTAVLEDNLSVVLTRMSNVRNLNGEDTIKYQLAQARAKVRAEAKASPTENPETRGSASTVDDMPW